MNCLPGFHSKQHFRACSARKPCSRRLDGVVEGIPVCCLLALLPRIGVKINVHRRRFKKKWDSWDTRLVSMSRATSHSSDAELVAMWCFLQLSRVGWVDLAGLVRRNKVCFHCILLVCCCGLLLNVLAVQEFNARGLRRALALSLIVRQPFPGLPAALQDPSCVAPIHPA